MLSTCVLAVLALCTFQDPADPLPLVPWEQLASAELVLHGDLTVEVEAFEAQRESGGYVPLWLSVKTTLKGVDPGKSVQVKQWIMPNLGRAAGEKAEAGELAGEVVLCLVSVADGRKKRSWYVQWSGAAQEQVIAAARDEIALQENLLMEFSEADERNKRKDEPLWGQTGALVEQVVADDPAVVQAAVDSLVQLGGDAVPHLILRLDDRRKLNVRGIAFKSESSEAIEGLRHYSPDQVIDCLSAILTNTTGKCFANIMNGGSDEERARELAGWRLYYRKVISP